LISSQGNKKSYSIFSGYDDDKIINQYLKFEIQENTINRGEISSDLNLIENNLFSNESIIYENNDFRLERFEKKLFENFFSFWSTNTEAIIKNKEIGLNSNYSIIQSILFYILFYFCITMIFVSKKLVNRGVNKIKVSLLVLFLFLYFLIVPKIILNNFQYLFQIISVMIFLLFFFKIKQYE